MNTIKSILIFFLFAIAGCSDDELGSYQNEGIITGADLRLCACCGGYFIEIENQTYRFYNLPDDGEIALPIPQGDFPITVELEWSTLEPLCLGDEISVLEIERK